MERTFEPIDSKSTRHARQDEMAKNDGGRATPSMFAVNNDRAVPLEVGFNQARKVDEHVAELGHLCGRHK